MVQNAHLWAVGFNDMEPAARVRDEIVKLAERHCLELLDSAVAVRYPDGSGTVDGVPFVTPIQLHERGIAGFFAALALGAPPLTAAAVGSLERGLGNVPYCGGSIGQDFVSEAQQLMKPGSSALFVLDQVGEMEAILQGIRGLGGTVLKTNVDLERARQIQSALATPAE